MTRSLFDLLDSLGKSILFTLWVILVTQQIQTSSPAPDVDPDRPAYFLAGYTAPDAALARRQK